MEVQSSLSHDNYITQNSVIPDQDLINCSDPDLNPTHKRKTSHKYNKKAIKVS